MAKNITEVSTFSTPIVVPEGTDSRNLAAENVEAIAQALGNRTKYIADNAGFKNGSTNTWQYGQAIDPASAATFRLTSTKTPHDHANPANKWGSIMRFAMAAGAANIAMYVGDGTSGQLAFTINASWNDATQQWHQEESTRPSYALIVDPTGELHYYKVPSGTGANWTSWPTAVGTFTVAEVITSSITAAAALIVGDVNVVGNVIGGANISLPGGSRVVYTGTTAAKRRYKIIPIEKLHVAPDSSGPATYGFGTIYVLTNIDSVAYLPIELPSGTVLETVEVMQLQDSVANVFNIYYELMFDWDTTVPVTPGSRTNAGAANQTDARVSAVDIIVTPLDAAGYAHTSNAVQKLWLKMDWKANNRFYGFRAVFIDSGPRND